MPSGKLECWKQVAKYGLRAMHKRHQHAAGRQPDIQCHLRSMRPGVGRPPNLRYLPEEFILAWWKCLDAKVHGMHAMVSVPQQLTKCITQ